MHAPDLWDKNYGDNESDYGVGIVIRVVECDVSFLWSKPAPKIFAIGKFIDGFQILVATDENHSAKSFLSFEETIPKDDQQCDKNLHRSIKVFITLLIIMGLL